MIRHINHIGIAVLSLAEQIPFYRDILRLEFLGEEEVAEQKVRVAMFRCGEVKIELLEPTDPESPIAKFLDKKGTGIHHIAYETEDLDQALDAAKAAGVRLIDEEPREGAHDTRIAFVHPASSGKILTELCQHGQGGES